MFKPTTMDSGMSESSASTEDAKRRMSSDMTEPRRGTPAGTATKALVIIT
jgi:hypothetical protein